MRVHRVYVPGPLAAGEPLDLPEAASAHVARVLRLGPGDAVTVFDGDGSEHDARIVTADPRKTTVEVGRRRAVNRESPLRVRLVQGVSRGERMDFAIQKSVELGVAAIEPVIAARSVVRLDPARAARRRDHWQRVAEQACEQCGRNVVPVVHPLRSLSVWLDEAEDLGLALLLAPDGAGGVDLPHPRDGAVTLLVGPEGGLDEAERSFAIARGFRPMRLGPRTLRTETAPIAALAALQARWGDLG